LNSAGFRGSDCARSVPQTAGSGNKGTTVEFSEVHTEKLKDGILVFSRPDRYLPPMIEVKYQEETKDALRFPVFIRVREDK